MELIFVILWWFADDFLEENYPRIYRWVFLPLVIPLALLVVIGGVASCVDDLVSDDAAEIVDCSNPDIRCINMPH